MWYYLFISTSRGTPRKCSRYPRVPRNPGWESLLYRVSSPLLLSHGTQGMDPRNPDVQTRGWFYGRLSRIISHISASFCQKGRTCKYKTCILNQITQYIQSSTKENVVLIQPCTKSGRHVAVGTEYFRVGRRHETFILSSFWRLEFWGGSYIYGKLVPSVLIIYV
jgi:hypothetical protein